MICPDCELEVDKLTSRGMCKRCYKRIYSCKSRNQEYVPLREIKGTTEYNRAMGKILATEKRKGGAENKTSIKKEKTSKNNEVIIKKSPYSSLKEEYYLKVSKDIESAFNEEKIKQDYIKHKNLDEWIETFFGLLDENGFIMDAKRGENVFNRLFLLYKHAQENVSWEDVDKLNEIGYDQKALSELRRPTKDLLDYYTVINDMIVYLRQDRKFMEMFYEARIQMEKKAQYHKDPKYYAEVASDLVDDGFILGINPKKNKLYDCTVWCFNLNGNSNKRLFRLKNGMIAKSETDAKLKFKAFLIDKFSTLRYKEEDIHIEEVESYDVIEQRTLEQNSKECL